MRSCPWELRSRAWSQPALRYLWKKLPSLVPIFHLFAPDDVPCPHVWDIISEYYAERVLSLPARLLISTPSRAGHNNTAIHRLRLLGQVRVLLEVH